MLKPYSVLDFTDERGEIGAMLLGDLGAEVIRVEPPGGSAARVCEPLLKDAPDELKSLQFQAFNRNKRSIVLDPAVEEDVACLEELIRRTDFIFESAPGRVLESYHIDFEQAKQLNPHIVYVRISPFGDSGPYSNYLGNDLVVAALGGPVSLQGNLNRPPIRISVPQVWRHAGTEAAAGALVAHAKMRRSGQPQFVDVSAQCTMTWTMLNGMNAKAIQGFEFERSDSAMSNGAVRIELVHRTVDGFIVALPMSKVIKGCMSWMIADGVIDESYKDIDWQTYDLNIRDPDAKSPNVGEMMEVLRRFFALHTKLELYEFGVANGITLAPVNTLEELLALEHIKIRDYWQELELPGGGNVSAPGMWAKTSSSAPLSVRRGAPGLNEHGAEIRAELEQPGPVKHQPLSDDKETHDEDALPFAGIKVTDFAWVGVGPISSKYLADHGADVVRVESESRPDVLRGGVPFANAEPGLNRSQFYGDFNTSKQSISLDMKSTHAIEIARQLISGSDVLIESFAPGAITRMGLGYEEVCKLNPGIIMISTCLMGQTGPAAGLAGYGYHAAAIAGFYEITGYTDEPPSGPWVAYTDTIAPRFVSILLAAALDHRRRTGEGCYIDVAQIETALHYLAPELLDLQVSGSSPSRIANRSVYAAPQGCYPCDGPDSWCAIAVDTDEQWHLLCREIGKEAWVSNPKMATSVERRQTHDEIDAAISAWTKGQLSGDVMQRLQAIGVPAGVVQRSGDLIKDPQYAYRNFYRYFDHPEMGHIPYAGHQYTIQGYNNGPRGPAPLLGEHSFEILSQRLKMEDTDIAKAYASGVIT
ncbi:MAG: CoA transferase [bacterium]|nr:CoA transferase [Gammaproteobacteria bacterium]